MLAARVGLMPFIKTHGKTYTLATASCSAGGGDAGQSCDSHLRSVKPHGSSTGNSDSNADYSFEEDSCPGWHAPSHQLAILSFLIIKELPS